jgi:hypothetical protein
MSKVTRTRASLLAITVESGKKKARLLDKVKTFHEASRRGDYHDAFDVNSKKFMDTSEGDRRVDP